MAQPVWITSSGSLGTVPEGIYYNVPVQAQAGSGETVFYRLIAGSLPTNVFCDITGDIAGVPSSKVIAGQDVSIAGALITSKFTIRAYTTANNQSTGRVLRICDRTFTITVAGANAPRWITPAGNIGAFYDGALLQPGFQFEYTDNPLPGVTPISLVSGQLPTGLTISGTGLLSGYFAPDPAISVLSGFSRDGQGFDEYAFDFNTDSLDYTYEFTLQVTNGVVSEQRTFTMTVWNPTSFNASTTLITSDNDILQASISNIIPPVIINPQGSIGTYRNDNFFAYQFIAYDYSNNPVTFEGFDLPPGLTLDATTGWLYGYIPNLGLTEETYTFTIRASEPFNVNPYTTSLFYTYSITYIGPIGSQITWLSPSDLGTIDNGATSTFTIKAVDQAGISLQYRLKSGSNSRLPQGLTLLPSGNIVGRVSFNTFALDNNTTTIDSGATTFDLTYTFTVNAYSTDGTISVFKEFTIHVVNAYPVPYNNLYISCMPPRDDRALIQDLLQDDNIFPQELIYRADDPNFGIATSVIYNHAYGLSSTIVNEYVYALELNHYWKNLILGEIKTARAVDDLGNVIYEVVYSEIVDDQVNELGESASKQEVLAYPVAPNTSFQIADIYPNSLVNMRDQVIDSVGQVSNILPRWMYSQQADGRILGFTPAWVIAYTQPNASGQIAYNIQQQFGADKLNLVDFKADRYELDRSMTALWDPETESWIPSPAEEVTFDVTNHYQLTSINITPPTGFGYSVTSPLTTLSMPGSYFGGTDGHGNVPSDGNDLTLRICQVSDNGGIEQAFTSGFAPTNSAGEEWAAVPATGIDGPAATSSSATISASTPRTVAGSIEGTRLSVSGGNPSVGQLLSASGVAPYTYIQSPIFGVITNSTTYTGISGTSARRGYWEGVTPLSTSGAGTGAIFNVRKNNLPTPYNSNTVITMVYGGEGYKLGDEITISGADLGGATPTNDLRFTLSTSISNGVGLPSYWTVSVSQTTTLSGSSPNARTYNLTVGGDITGTFAPGEYITSETVTPATRIIAQMTSTTTAIATPTATAGSVNNYLLTVSSVAGIEIGQIVSGTGIPEGTFVTAINDDIITLSQSLTLAASGTYTFRNTGGTGIYAVNTAQSVSTPVEIIATTAIFNIESVPGEQTTFDGGSMQFASPADITTNTNAFDRYILYPKSTVITNLPQSATWTNSSGEPIEWVNDTGKPEAFWNT